MWLKQNRAKAENWEPSSHFTFRVVLLCERTVRPRPALRTKASFIMWRRSIIYQQLLSASVSPSCNVDCSNLSVPTPAATSRCFVQVLSSTYSMQSTLAGVRSLLKQRDFCRRDKGAGLWQPLISTTGLRRQKEERISSVSGIRARSREKKKAIRWSGGGVDLNITARERERKKSLSVMFFSPPSQNLTGPIGVLWGERGRSCIWALAVTGTGSKHDVSHSKVARRIPHCWFSKDQPHSLNSSEKLQFTETGSGDPAVVDGGGRNI